MADNPLPQPFFHMHELLRLAFQQPANRNTSPLAHQLGDVFFVDFFFQHGSVFLHRRESLLRLLQIALSRRNLAVANLRHLGQLAGAFVFLFFGF